MARKIKFALEMADGAKVRGSIEELREHFDLEKAVGYFLSGKLTEWLEDRFYEDEAEAIAAIEKDAPDLRERLCAALDVPYEGDSELDIAALERMNEKKAILRQKTGDEEIISHAAQTALNQEDLADLLEMDEAVIYLCGEKFNIPARVKNKKYVGILGTPTISIKAASQNELDEKGIVFENVKLPWGQEQSKSEATKACPKCAAPNSATAKFCSACGSAMNGAENAPKVWSDVEQEAPWIVPKMQMKAMFAATFQKDLQELGADVNDTFLIIKLGSRPGLMGGTPIVGTVNKELTQEQKKLALSLICDDRYTENDLVQLRISEDMTRGWALTNDSFCIKDPAYDDVIITPYQSISFDNVHFFWPSRGDEKNYILYLQMFGTYETQDALQKYIKNMTALFSRKKFSRKK